ncbi:MAG: hypothetical protein J3K34DRAFT_43005 [Monoraphidium minutum]|nr:MAG: hypothetical protein J3K34DRAFT_43005 [Monoraphidium minutum]
MSLQLRGWWSPGADHLQRLQQLHQPLLAPAAVAGLAGVEMLGVDDCLLDARMLALVLLRLPRLWGLSLDGCDLGQRATGQPIADIASILAATSPGLEMLRAEDFTLDATGAALLARLPKLTDLNISASEEGAAAAAAWAALQPARLTSLRTNMLPSEACLRLSGLLELQGIQNLTVELAGALARGAPLLRLLSANVRGAWATPALPPLPRVTHAWFDACEGFAGARLSGCCRQWRSSAWRKGGAAPCRDPASGASPPSRCCHSRAAADAARRRRSTGRRSPRCPGCGQLRATLTPRRLRGCCFRSCGGCQRLTCCRFNLSPTSVFAGPLTWACS